MSDMRMKHVFYLFFVGVLLALGVGAEETPERLWTYRSAGGYFDASPAIGDVDQDGRPDIIVATTEGRVVALDANAAEIWRYEAQDEVATAPTLYDVTGTIAPEVLILTQAGRLICLEGQTGDFIWEHALSEDIRWGSMAIAVADLEQDGSVEIVTASLAGQLICLDGRGKVLWTFKEPQGIYSAPAVGDLTGDGVAEILIASKETPLICVSHKGDFLWRMDTSALDLSAGRLREVAAPVIWDIDGDGDTEILTGLATKLAAIDERGTVLWTVPMRNRIDSAIAVADLNDDGAVEILAADLSGKLVCVSPKGEVNWEHQLANRARRSPSIADIDGDGALEVLVAGYSGKIDVFSANGVLEASPIITGGSNATATVADLLGDGGLCAITPEMSGSLSVYRWMPKTESPRIIWPGYRNDARRTGSAFPETLRTQKDGLLDVYWGNLYEEHPPTESRSFYGVRVGNPQQDALKIRLAIEQNAQLLQEVLRDTTAMQESVDMGYPQELQAGMPVRFLCSVQQDGTVLEKHCWTIPFVDYAQQYDNLNTALETTAALLDTLPDKSGIEETLFFVQGKAQALANAIEKTANLLAVERRALRDNLAEYTSSVARLTKMATAAAQAEAPIVAYAANPWAVFGGMDEIIEGRTPAADLLVEAFPGEVESAALNVFNFSGVARTVRVSADALKNGDSNVDGGVLAFREAIETPTQMADQVADALPLLGQANTLVLPPWSGRQLWVTVDTKTLTPGTWTSAIHLETVSIKPVQCAAPLKVVMWNTPLPEKQALRLCHWGRTDTPAGAFENQLAYGTNIFARSVPPTATFDETGALTQIDYTAHDAFMQKHAPHGVILFHSLVHLKGPEPAFSPIWKKAYAAFMKDWIAHLATLGYGYEDFAFYPIDEPGLEHGKRIKIFMQWALWMQECDPNVRMYANPVGEITQEQLETIAPYVDVWCPLGVGKFPRPLYAIMHSHKGAEYWNYTCSDNARHRCSLGYYRGQAWMAWEQGHAGIGFWTYHSPGQDAWKPPVGNTDYDLIYPGQGIVTSKRWEAVRDGVEDFSMLDKVQKMWRAAKIFAADSALLSRAQQLFKDDASIIAHFCYDEEARDVTTPGKLSPTQVRQRADQRWEKLKEVRRGIAKALDELKQP